MSDEGDAALASQAGLPPRNFSTPARSPEERERFTRTALELARELQS